MNIESKVLRLEREILGRGNGATAWALELAEETIRRHLYRPSRKHLKRRSCARRLNVSSPKPQEPNPISSETDVEQFAATR